MENSKIIKIEMPAEKNYSSILRLAAAGAADVSGLDIDIIEDVKVVVSEVFGSIIEAGCGGAVVCFEPGDRKLTISFETCSGEAVLKGANDMTIPILEALVKKVVVENNGGLTLVVE